MSLRCPVCRKIAMKEEVDPVTGLEIDVCPSCSGMWFDAKELNQFFESPTLKTKLSNLHIFRNSYTLVSEGNC